MQMETSTFDAENLHFDDQDTWDLISSGRTKGVFQLESSLGKSWAKRVKPNNIEELSDLIAIIRPGCLKAVVDGKTMTQHYVDRKNEKESVTYIHPSLEPILKKTQGVLVYQEQSMQIAQQLAGFTLEDADNLRKAIGKKKADLMAKVKEDFIAGAEKQNTVDKETAEEIFSWIEKSSRYAFNKSHSVSYAICSYWSAYAKFHYPLEFYSNYLKHSGGKPDPQKEGKELVVDAKSNDINVHPPSLKYMNKETVVKDGKIYFGLTNVKSLGERAINSIVDKLPENAHEMSWYEFLIETCGEVNKTYIQAMIESGVVSVMGVSRQKMKYEFTTVQELSKKEQEWVKENYKDYEGLIPLLRSLARPKKEGGGVANKNRLEMVMSLVDMLENPPMSLEDDPNWIIQTETNYYGTPLTFSEIDTYDTSRSDTTCKDIINGKIGTVKIAATIVEYNKYIPTKGKAAGKEMVFMQVEDGTGSIENVTMFNESWIKHKNITYIGNNILLVGKASSGDRAGIIVDEMYEL